MSRFGKKTGTCPQRLWNTIRKRKFAALGLFILTTLCLYEVYLTEAYLSDLNLDLNLQVIQDAIQVNARHADPLQHITIPDGNAKKAVVTAVKADATRAVVTKLVTEKLAEATTPKPSPPVIVKEKKEKAKPTKRPPPSVVKILPPAPTARKPGPDTRYLVYVCDEGHWCGGWGDRQRGFTSAYLLARVTDREFRLIMSTPCDLSKFFAPNKVKWKPKKGELDTNSKITLVGISNQSITDIIKSSDFNEVFPQKVIYFRTNGDYFYHLRHNNVYSKMLSQWNALGDKKARFRWAWNDLMIPTERTLKLLERLVGPTILINRGLTSKPLERSENLPAKEVGSSSLICAHVRIGKNPTIPMDNVVVKFKFEDLPGLYEFMRDKSKGQDSRFFVATDYDLIRNLTRTFFGDNAVGYGGIIMHIDRQRRQDSACSGFEIALVEQLLLSVCDYLVLSDSGFSRHAAFISNSSLGHVYQMEGGKAKNVM